MPQTFAAIPLRTNGPEILAEHMNIIRQAGIDLAAAAPVWTKYTIAYTDIQTAALTNTLELFSLAAKGIIEGFIVKHSTAFAGTSITDVKLQIGTLAEADRFLESFDVDAVVADATFSQATMSECLSPGSATSIKIKFTAVGANLSALTAGSVDVWVKTSTLP